MTGAEPAPSYLVAGRYRLVRRIGHGGMGAVWLARDQLLDREVAVKQVLSTAGMREDAAAANRQRAMREGRLAARLSHRNAISMHDVALDGDDPWLVMEYLPSHSVADVLHNNGSMAPIEAAQIAAQVADAITEAHASGIIHRDIKPANILIASSGRSVGLVKITDFGISRAKDDVSITLTGIVTGTPAYFAPEVARGDEPGEASDVYSLGATLYTMIEGHPPYGNTDNYVATLHRAANAEIDPPTHAGDLTPLLLTLLNPSPQGRPSMAQARDLLVQYAAGELGTSERVLTGLIRTKPLRAASRRTLAPPAASSGPSQPPRTRVSDQQSMQVPQSMYAPRATPEPVPPQYVSGQPYQPTAGNPYSGQPYQHYPQQQPPKDGNLPLAAAIFAIFVLLTAIVAGIIVLAA
ncbi:serine/threonine-protein kinase [Gordonia zhaorongruii]|uniref:serine/threonine-protein kinase n=1 Tax=Gordonia zhaorongruii TaxID=2597659 RepID=UPI0010529899|nr:serine/threonine-protein kinase [Gordonia zhaorongruii]